jgi:hypothetical protein
LYADYELTPEWKNYISFMNKGFNEGLFGQEFYIQKPEQRDAKIINGEYAVVKATDGTTDCKAKTAPCKIRKYTAWLWRKKWVMCIVRPLYIRSAKATMINTR